MRKAKSIPAETPAEVKTGSVRVKRISLRILVLSAASRRKSNARQWVVDSRPSNNPAFPRRLEPVQTDAVIFVFAYISAIHFKRVSFFTSLRVPQPPGTRSRSRFGQL